MPNVDFKSDSYECIAFFTIGANVLITSILHQLSIPHLRIPEKKTPQQTQAIEHERKLQSDCHFH